MTKNTIVEFPLNRTPGQNYVQNKASRYGGTGSDVVQAKTINIKAGVYKVEIDPLTSSDNATGSATITINPT